MIDCFLYNRDAGSLITAPRPRYHVLIAQGFAATGGPQNSGEQLRRLGPGDRLLMYENMVGVVATGIVRERRDGLDDDAYEPFAEELLNGLISDSWSEI